MVIICDTRQKAGKHQLKHRYFERHGYELQFLPLAVGDYMLPNSNISVDTKRNLNEVAINIFHGKDRFLREVKRAQNLGIRLVFLIEHGHGITSLESVREWQNQYGKVQGKAVEWRMRAMQLNYGVEWEFCSKRETGRRILEILNGEVVK